MLSAKSHLKTDGVTEAELYELAADSTKWTPVVTTVQIQFLSPFKDFDKDTIIAYSNPIQVLNDCEWNKSMMKLNVSVTIFGIPLFVNSSGCLADAVEEQELNIMFI